MPKHINIINNKMIITTMQKNDLAKLRRLIFESSNEKKIRKTKPTNGMLKRIVKPKYSHEDKGRYSLGILLNIIDLPPKNNYNTN